MHFVNFATQLHNTFDAGSAPVWNRHIDSKLEGYGLTVNVLANFLQDFITKIWFSMKHMNFYFIK